MQHEARYQNLPKAGLGVPHNPHAKTTLAAYGVGISEEVGCTQRTMWKVFAPLAVPLGQSPVIILHCEVVCSLVAGVLPRVRYGTFPAIEQRL